MEGRLSLEEHIGVKTISNPRYLVANLYKTWTPIMEYLSIEATLEIQ
jgi:hypothetical protein